MIPKDLVGKALGIIQRGGNSMTGKKNELWAEPPTVVGERFTKKRLYELTRNSRRYILHGEFLKKRPNGLSLGRAVPL